MECVKLTQYSHGAGCGCKIAPKVLKEILDQVPTSHLDPKLLVGNGTLDDAAVYEIDDDNVIISTTDFFMPIVDDPEDFGAIASVNAISDIYAMGGKPLMALAILCWPTKQLDTSVAAKVMNGARKACKEAGITIAGGHSIDGPEPIFGLAVTGIAKKNMIKKNASGQVGCNLYLSKPLGVGILSTAQKKGLLDEEDRLKARNSMITLNKIGAELGTLEGVTAMTDVTGFGLLGHLKELCEGSGMSSEISMSKVPLIDGLQKYIDLKTFPGGTHRNFDSYGDKISPLTEEQKSVLCDPQTSGGLLVAVRPDQEEQFFEVAKRYGWDPICFGQTIPTSEYVVHVKE
ncbi:selenide, water dikinase SelD [Halosquirtibacter xylanolyticus]|uniref:selenide, water dikinase SelD n=1 Tax=Halosquirtibacter xylanolyticus TaxID=3374599 RepID=UPI00374A7D80|nr:selenide, water dikinase SelD [Prolixibacteraceae bacterium]